MGFNDLFYFDGPVLRLYAEFGGFEGVSLCHRLFGAVKDISYKLPEEGISHLARYIIMFFDFVINQVYSWLFS